MDNKSKFSPAARFVAFRSHFITTITDNFGLNKTVTGWIFIVFCLSLVCVFFFFLHSAPPTSLTITTGPEGSIFYTNATKYATNLSAQGIKLNIQASHGSLDNLQKLSDPKVKVDVGFVQGGVTNGMSDDLVSLGSISHQPLLVFYRGPHARSLADLSGKCLAIGPEGSGTRSLALTLLAANNFKTNDSENLPAWDSKTAAKAILDGKVDAIFLMGEDAASSTIRSLLLATNVNLLSFEQAEAYTRKFNYLSVLKLPQGGVDLAKNIPPHDTYLVGPTVEIIARKSLHPAISDLLLAAAKKVHGNASMLQQKNEFPAPIEHDIPISPDAARFYKSGASFFYRYLPFWLASLTSRIVVFIIPTILVIVPVVRSIPPLYRLRTQLQIRRWYRALINVEKELSKEHNSETRQAQLLQLDQIEKAVNRLKVPAALADQFYGLRGHIDFVRQIKTNKP